MNRFPHIPKDPTSVSPTLSGSGMLTVVIPFLNEREEVGNTIRSIKSTVGERVEIVAINDASDQDYDYETDLNGLDVRYIVNPQRIGAAQSKQKGVDLAQTPYFLILDAHMRFYTNDWDRRLVSLLEADPNKLLCCQTLSITKRDDGSITHCENDTGVFGAYISYDPHDYIPQAKWNHIPVKATTEGLQPIPCVLGAGYASSKAYWEGIKGMDGLIHYGSEEPFISIKSWQCGGGCYLVSDITIGHLYRQRFPYPVFHAERVYNNLMIAETLFPLADKCLAHAVARRQDPSSYYEAMGLIRKNYCELEQLRNHFSTWDGKTYAEFRSMNAVFARQEREEAKLTKGLLETLVRMIADRAHSINNHGLQEGTILYLLCLLAYSKRYKDNCCLENIIYRLWETLSDYLPDHSQQLFFKGGLAGIGWGLIYASAHKLIEDDIEPELLHIDAAISQLSPARIPNCKFDDGLGGILAYVTARLDQTVREGCKHGLAKSFLDELKSTACNVKDSCPDWRTFMFAMRFLECTATQNGTCMPLLEEVADINYSFAASPDYWNLSINDIAGACIKNLTE